MENKRKHTRFDPDTNTIVAIDVDGFKLIGLATQEAFKGCSAIFINNDVLKKDTLVKIKVGQLDEVRGIIRWTAGAGEKATEVGFEFDV